MIGYLDRYLARFGEEYLHKRHIYAMEEMYIGVVASLSS